MVTPAPVPGSSDLAGRIARAVAARRKQLLLTAASLSARTKKLGYPIAPAAIGKIESNERSGTINTGIALVELVNEKRQRHLDDFSLQIEVDGERDGMRADELRRRLAQGRQRIEALPSEIEDARKEL